MDELAGIWTAQQDGLDKELLISPEGTGWYEYGRRGEYQDISEFTWYRDAPNQFVVEYGETREVEEDGSVKRDDRYGESRSFTYELSYTSGDDRPNLLRLDPPLGGTTELVRHVRR